MGEGKGGVRGKERRRKGRGRKERGDVRGRRRRREGEGKRGGKGVEGVGK